jgi:hypothetical protein
MVYTRIRMGRAIDGGAVCIAEYAAIDAAATQFPVRGIKGLSVRV